MIGEDYIEKAFQYANDSDPNVELAYNDYNLWKPKKRKGAIKIINSLKEKGIRIDAVGIQAHWDLHFPSIKEIEETIVDLAATGVDVMITELDITVIPNPYELAGIAREEFKKFEGDEKWDPYQSGIPEGIQKKLTNWSIARTIIIYGITDNMSRSNIVLWAKSEIGKGNTINVVKDQYRSPTFAEDLAKGCISIIDKSALGLYHLSGPKTYSILDLVYQVADFYNLDKSLINPVTSASLKQPAKRPLVTGFDISKAKRDLDYNPVDFGEGIKIMHQQIKKYEV